MKYQYSNLPIPGGGFVTGFSYHPNTEHILYAKTDIGGTYRFDFENNRWVSLIDHVTGENLSETYPLAIGLDPLYENRLYIACGLGYDLEKNGVFCVSDDYGKTFIYYPLPCPVHGNAPGRGAGTRIAIDPADSDIIYFASQTGGLLVSKDRGKTFSRLPVPETHTIFVAAYKNNRSGNNRTTLVVSTAGLDHAFKQNGQAIKRGHSLYVSYDSGNSFEKLPYPDGNDISSDFSRLPGRIGHRFDFDGQYLYVTLSATGRWSYVVEDGYSCDSGDATDGAIIRYPVLPDGSLGDYEDITPDKDSFHIQDSCKFDFSDFKRGKFINCGFGGISSCPKVPGLLVSSTLCDREHGDMIFISKDYGNTWSISLYDLSIGGMHFHAPYMKPEYNGGHSLIHWLSDLKINPFNENELVFNSGTGVFHTTKLLSDNPSYSDFCQGIEETVHLNVYSPPKGDVCCIDIVGDLGGFAFTDPYKPCENSFADEHHNRYITCMNADYSDYDPMCVVVTPRGNWTGQTIGGLILSKDQCKTFTHLDLPYGITPYIDTLCDTIARPNNNSGWVSISPDTNTIIWSIADGMLLTSDGVVVSHNQGKTFQKVSIYDKQGILLSKDIPLKTFSDRVDSQIFYGFSIDSRIFISIDSGNHFYECEKPTDFPSMVLSNIDCANKAEIRGDAGKSGVFYIAMNKHGLWKLTCDVNLAKSIVSYDDFSKADLFRVQKLSQDGDSVERIGLGIPSRDADYQNCQKVLYVNGNIKGTYGFYKSMDDGKNFVRINSDQEMFGEINSIAGDAQVPGRFYLATGSRGLIMGQETEL